jgi:UDPglucose 6-dehydrogenase
MKNIGFIGLGKLGLDCAEVMAEKHTVRGFDIYPRISDTVKVCSIEETVNESEWIFIAVPTPHEEGYDGSVPSSHMTPKDFGHEAVKDALQKVNQYATTPKKVVLISTVLPGTTRRHFITLLDKKHQFLYNPYLIAMGSVKWDMVNPEMIMIGTKDGNPNALAGELIDIYKTIYDDGVIIKLVIPSAPNSDIYLAKIKEYILSKGWSYKKVQLLIPIIFWNMSPLHTPPFDKLLWYLGMKLFEELDNDN